MIKFFRKIRQQLLTENRFSKYLIYAIGEVSFIIIGIIVALSLNNWNQRRLNNTNETKYLLKISQELKISSKYLSDFVLERMTLKTEGLNLAKEYSENKLVIKDTLGFLNKVSFGAVFSGGISFGSNHVYEELLYTGNFQLIKEDIIKNTLTTLYLDLEWSKERSFFFASGYQQFISKLAPFNPKNSKFISKFDQEEMMVAFKTEEFRKLVDSELSYTYKVEQYTTRMKAKYEHAIKIIEEELTRNLSYIKEQERKAN